MRKRVQLLGWRRRFRVAMLGEVFRCLYLLIRSWFFD